MTLTNIEGTASGVKTLVRVRPRGFCAGVVRAVDIVELALEAYGRPVYVHHEIVHNRYVVDQLRRRGAIFVESIEEVPVGAVLVFSATEFRRVCAAKRKSATENHRCDVSSRNESSFGGFEIRA